MKNKKARTALCVAASLFFTALYIYALYSAYYIFKRGNGPETALYTVLLALCGGVVMLLYTLTDKKREHSTANKITVPIVSAAVHAGVYLAVGFGVQRAVAPDVAGALAFGSSCIMFAIALAVYLNGLSSRGHKALCKITALLCATALICPGLVVSYRAINNYSFLAPVYKISRASSNIGGIPTSDSDIVYDFAYATEKDLRDTALGSDESIDIALARNEWEGFQIIFATAKKGKKVEVSVTDFKNADGDTLRTEAYKAHYSEVKGMGGKYSCEYADAMIPAAHTGKYGGPAELEKGLQQAFFIRTRAEKDAKAGEYTATVTAKNEKNEVILEKEIKAVVWNFTLPDTPANESAFGNSSEMFATLSGVKDGDNAAREKLNVQVYELLAENRLSPYNIPYDILDERADKYMSDPRITSFVIPYPEDDGQLVKYYEKVSSNPEWAKKGYFYPIDEPGDSAAYERYREITERLARLCPGYNMVTPFNTDEVKINGNKISSVKLQNGRSSILCGLSDVVGRGSTLEEMTNAAKNGSRAWWYVCCAPGGDYCNFFIHLDALKHRILMWQQKSINITGLLYWCTTYCEKANPWESAKTWDSFDCSGDGMFIYPGGYIGIDGPVSTMRLFNIADGMEDYDYFTLAEAKFGRAWVDERIAKVTSSLTEYTSDHTAFEQVRREIGEALSEK